MKRHETKVGPAWRLLTGSPLYGKVVQLLLRRTDTARYRGADSTEHGQTHLFFCMLIMLHVHRGLKLVCSCLYHVYPNDTHKNP